MKRLLMFPLTSQCNNLYLPQLPQELRYLVAPSKYNSIQEHTVLIMSQEVHSPAVNRLHVPYRRRVLAVRTHQFFREP